jgi:hypothetical protein
MACGNNHVSRASISSAPRAAPRLSPPKDSPEEMIRSGRLLGSGRVSNAFTQNRAEIGKPGWQSYRDERTGTVREARVVAVKQADGTTRHITIREKVDVNGQVTDILANEGVRKEITDRYHAHWKLRDDERGIQAHRDTPGVLLNLLKDLGQHEFSGGLGVLGQKSVPFVDRDGRPRDPNARDPRDR